MGATDAVEKVVEASKTFLIRYIPKDVMGKVLPGLVVLVAFLWTLADARTITSFLGHLTFFHWLLLSLVGWLIGFAVQGVGEWTGYVQGWPVDHYGESRVREWLGHYYAATGKASDEQQGNLDRYAVIHEAAGNGSMAALVAAAILLTDALLGKIPALGESNPMHGLLSLAPRQLILLGLVVAFLALALFRVNRLHVERRFRMVLEIAGIAKTTLDAENMDAEKN